MNIILKANNYNTIDKIYNILNDFNDSYIFKEKLLINYKLNEDEFNLFKKILSNLYLDQLSRFVLYSRLLENTKFKLLNNEQKYIIYNLLKEKINKNDSIKDSILEKINKKFNQSHSFHLNGFINFMLKDEINIVENEINDLLIKNVYNKG